MAYFLDFTTRDKPIGNDIAEQGSRPDSPLKNPLAFELVGQRRGEAVLIHCIYYQLFHALFQIMATGLQKISAARQKSKRKKSEKMKKGKGDCLICSHGCWTARISTEPLNGGETLLHSAATRFRR